MRFIQTDTMLVAVAAMAGVGLPGVLVAGEPDAVNFEARVFTNPANPTEVLPYVLARPADAGGSRQQPPPLPVLPPTALCGDAGDGRAFLRWNLQLEDERVVGWRVAASVDRQTEPNAAARPEPVELTGRVRGAMDERGIFREPCCVVESLTNGSAYTFRVVGVLADGGLTPPSNTATVVPRPVGKAKVVRVGGGGPLSFGDFSQIPLGQNAWRIVFPDGQELVYDGFRPVDWTTADGVHLLYPRHFGNGMDIGMFDDRGLPLVIPAATGRTPPDEPFKQEPWITEGSQTPLKVVNIGYKDYQWGTAHPDVTDPMTLPIRRDNPDAAPRWLEPTIEDDRVTLRYMIPIAAFGYRAMTYVRVWETWWPVQRDRHGCLYNGLARLVEVEMPGSIKRGYQVMLNDGFGPAGSRKGVVSYNTRFRGPTHEVIDYSGEFNEQVGFQHLGLRPRQGYGYHPNHDSLQASPLIFYDWGAGSLTISARSLYYHCANKTASYVEKGADGVWPNLAWDIGEAGKRVAVDTVEYLYTSDTSQPLPQRYSNARFEVYGDVSRRMGVQDRLVGTAMACPHSQIKHAGGPIAFAEKFGKQHATTGCDMLGNFLDTWQSSPEIVDDAYRLSLDHDCNPALAAMCRSLLAQGYRPGFWFRPDVVKSSVTSALGEHIHTTVIGQATDYPDGPEILARQGIEACRKNPQWIRRLTTGGWPYQTHYQWVPMSLATEWWDRIMWPAVKTSAAIGYRWVLHDGGFGGLQGVDYAPMLMGKTDHAVPCQPFWWRMYRSMHHVGIDLVGECSCGWKGADVCNVGNDDEHFLWMVNMAYIHGLSLRKPEPVHKLYQLYNAMGVIPGCDPVQRFARRFYETNGPPDWIEFRDLAQGQPVEVNSRQGDSPVAHAYAADTDRTKTVVVSPWTWKDVVWHYDDGREIVYPAYDKIDWTTE